MTRARIAEAQFTMHDQLNEGNRPMHTKGWSRHTRDATFGDTGHRAEVGS